MNTTEKVAYLRGLVEGLGVDDSTKEGKVISVIVDVLDDIALSIADLEDEVVEMGDQLNMVDEDLASLEDDIYEDDDEDDDECDCEGDLFEVTCPACGDEIYIDDEMLDDGEIVCPNCGEKIEFDLEDGEDCEGEDGCDCGHCH